MDLFETLNQLGIGNSEFFLYMQDKTKILNAGYPDSLWGAFPIVNTDGILEDIRLLVPEIINEHAMLINIHEYTHAYELYQELGMPYVENRKERESRARIKEKTYLEKKE